MICLPAPFPRWPRDRAGWKGAAPRPALAQQSGEKAAPEAEPPSCPRVSLPPPGGERRAPRCPPSAPPPRGLRLIFPAGKRRAADKGMPVVSCLFCRSLRWAKGTWGASSRQRPGLFCLGLGPPVWYKSASLRAAGGQGENTPTLQKASLADLEPHLILHSWNRLDSS